MPDTDSTFRDVFGYLLCTIISLSMLVYLFLIVTPDCADLTITSGGTARCEMGPGLYWFSAAFIAITVYAVSKMCRILFPARFS
jgi:hypothetical protein